MEHEATNRADEIVSCLSRHPAVAGAAIEETRNIEGNLEITVWIVPDRERAGPVRRACEAMEKSELRGLSLHEPSDELLVMQKNSTETDFLYKEVFIDRAYSRHDIAVPDGACVVDVGANIGMFSLFAAFQAKRVRIVAIEPSEELCRALKANAAIHDINMTMHRCAVGAAPGFAEFTYYPNNTAMSGLFADSAEDKRTLSAYLKTAEPEQNERILAKLVDDRLAATREIVRVRTLTDIIDQHSIERIDLLKIDVEKAESDVLAGMSDEVWNRVAQIAIEAHDVDGRLDEIVQELTNRGFVVAVEHEQALVNTNCVSVYGRRSLLERSQKSKDRPNVRWSSRQKLSMDLAAHLSEAFPDIRRIAKFEFVDTLPRITARRADGAVAAVSSIERTLIDLWCRRFSNVPDIGPETDFFAIGGNSLSAIRLIAEVEEIFGEGVLPPDAIFQNGKLGSLAATIESAIERTANGD
jgi:FkbM family methyltransferase